MAVTTAVLTGNVTDLTGTADPTALRSARLAIESSTTDSALLDTAGNKVMVGLEQVTIDTTTGAFSKTLVRTDSADIVPAAGRMYRAHLRYTSKLPNGSSGAKTLTSGWFTLTADSTLASKWTGIEAVSVPATANLNDVAMTNVDALTTSTFRVQQDARQSGLYAARAANLSDLASAITARTNLGLGTAATVNTGTTSGQIPLLGASGTLAVARLATGTADGTKFVRDDGTLAVPAGGSGATLLAHVGYRPAAVTSVSTTSTTPVDADATNLAITFTAPTSGTVLVTLQGIGYNGSPSYYAIWSLRSGTTDVVGSDAVVLRAAANEYARVTTTCRITGLTAGASYTYKWAHRTTNAGGTTYLSQGGTEFGVSSFGTSIMQVWGV